MPTTEEHLLQAYHNYDALGLLSSIQADDHFSDWYVTICFYCAVHYIEAFIFQTGKLNVASLGELEIDHSSDAEDFYGVKSPHTLRKYLLRDNQPLFRKIEADYRTLYEMSRVARYYCERPQNQDFTDAGQRLEAIKAWGDSHMPAPAGHKPFISRPIF